MAKGGTSLVIYTQVDKYLTRLIYDSDLRWIVNIPIEGLKFELRREIRIGNDICFALINQQIMKTQ